MSHGLHPAKKLDKPPSKTRVVAYLFEGDWTAEDEQLVQRAVDQGVVSQAEMCRSGLWFNGPPGQKLRELCAELERRGLRRERFE